MTEQTLEQIYQNHTGKVSDKWTIYLEEYDRVFCAYRHKPIRMLEIGIQNGGSLEIWAKYFEQAEQFVGSDINPDCANLVYDDARIKVVIGDATGNDAAAQIFSLVSAFDIVLDDGSHRSSDIIKSFARYFPKMVDGGVFIAEDLHCSYWEEFEGGVFNPYSALAFFKKLADITNYEHWGVSRSRSSILAGFFAEYGFDIDEDTLQHIHSIEFINSMCVIKKMAPKANTLGSRFIAGQVEPVVPGNTQFRSTLMAIQDQTNNEWASGMIPEDEILVRRNQVNTLMQRQSLLNASVMALQQDRTSLGSVLGRLINNALTRIAPAGTRRHRVANLAAHFFRTVESDGTRVAVRRAMPFVLGKFKTRRQVETGVPGVAADHPQLGHWISLHEPTKAQLQMQIAEAKKFSYLPKISALVPVYKLPRDVLEETINCMEVQTYPNWQACFVWADTEDLSGWAWLKKRTELDERFKVELLKENGGISRNSDAALALVDGEFIALLDHDDTLAPWAFYEVVSLLQSRPQLDFIYSDKDSISADGKVRMNALFKPDWSPEMLHSVNYLTHLNVIRTSLVREVGGWRPETDGAQDWDLFFRITEKTNNIARITSILYHWRILPTSTASGLHVKPYAALAQLKTQQDHFMRRGLAAAVVPSDEGMFKVCWLARPGSIDVIVYQTGSDEQLIGVLATLLKDEQPSVRRLFVVTSQRNADKVFPVPPMWRERVVFSFMETVNWRASLKLILPLSECKTMVLLDGSAHGFSSGVIDEIGGWVTEHPDISWASALAVDSQQNVCEAGRLMSLDGRSAPLFAGSPLHSYGWFGGPLWYRNSSACSPYAVAMRRNDVARALEELNMPERGKVDFPGFCRKLSVDGRRGLINPFARIYFEQAPEKDWVNEGTLFHSDPYFSSAFSQVSPLELRS